MKTITPFVAALALLSLSSISQGIVLFSDNFDVTGPYDDSGPSFQNNNPGRQGGSLGVLNYTKRGNVQVGNTGTLPPGPGSNLGDELLLAFDAGTFIDHDFSSVSTPLEILFSGLVSSIENKDISPETTWIGLIVGDLTDKSFVTDVDAGILFRKNGGTEIWNDGDNSQPNGTGAAPGFDVWTNYKVILSDTAGTGSAFGTGGSRADYYANGVLLGTATFNQLTAGQGYIGFSLGNWIGGVDNVQISTVPVPEPSTAILGLGGLMSLGLVRRRK